MLNENAEFGMDLSQLAESESIYSENLLKGKRVIISGGGSGIGKATAWLFARLGAKVSIVGRTIGKLQITAEGMRNYGLNVDAHQVNIRDPEAVSQLFNELWWRDGPVDILVNSAGGQFPQNAIDFSPNGWKSVIDTNLNGTWFMMQAAAKQWATEGVHGNIINLVAVVNRGMPGVAHTCAARAGVIYVSKSVAVEWAPLNIRVNCIAPGVTNTEGMAVYPKDAVKHFSDSNPMRRFASAWEIAEAAAYLASGASNFMTGEVLTLDGGGSLWGELWTNGKPEYFMSKSI